MLAVRVQAVIAAAIVIHLVVTSSIAAERINHEGRILGSLPVITNALLFNTPEADAVVSAMQIFPRDNAWNEDISLRPLLVNSAAMMTQITNDLATNRQTLRPFYEMNFVLVPNAQPAVPIAWDEYGDESDPSPYPFPTNTPVETWPRQLPGWTLTAWQRTNDGSDRHSIVVMPGSNLVWETWQTVYRTNSLTNWHAANGARFNMNSNTLRPLGWTSGDAAGLSMFGGLVRYDECQRGMVEHALRLVVRTNAARIHLSCDAPGRRSSRHQHQYAGDGATAAAQIEFQYPDELDDGGKGGAARVEKVRRDCRGQRRVLLHFRRARSALCQQRVRSSFHDQRDKFRSDSIHRRDERAALAGCAAGERRRGPNDFTRRQRGIERQREPHERRSAYRGVEICTPDRRT